jgi:hypothetical protein
VTGNVGGNVAGSVGSVTGAVGSVTGNVGGNVTGSVGSVAAGGITASSIATGAIDADALATDAAAEIADAVWDEAIAGHLTAGSTGEALDDASAGGGLDAAGVRAAVGLASANLDTQLGDLPTAAEIVTALSALDIDGDTWLEMQRVIYAILAGRSSGLTDGYGTAVFRDVANTKNRATVAISADGNRTSSTLDGT